MKYGQRKHRHGAVHYWLTHKRIPADLQADNTFWRLGDVRVVLCPCEGFVITVHRDDRKRKYRKYSPDTERRTICACCGRRVA